MAQAEVAGRGLHNVRDAARLMIAGPTLGTVAAIALLIWRGELQPATLWLLLVFYVLSAVGVEVGFHRLFAHRAYEAGPRLRLILGLLGSLGGQGPLLYWVAVHREHHRFVDTDRDPHAPRGGLRGFLHAHVGWMFRSEPSLRGLSDLLRDRAALQAHKLYLPAFAAGLVAPAVIGGGVGGWIGALEGLLWGGAVRIFLMHHATWSLNSFCHMVGHRPFDTRDQSRNLWFLALPTFGASWHNNHHAFPQSAVNDHRPWQLDPGAWVIRLAEATGFVWNVKRPQADDCAESRKPPPR